LIIFDNAPGVWFAFRDRAVNIRGAATVLSDRQNMNNDYLRARAFALLLILGMNWAAATARAAPDEIVVFTDEL